MRSTTFSRRSKDRKSWRMQRAVTMTLMVWMTMLLQMRLKKVMVKPIRRKLLAKINLRILQLLEVTPKEILLTKRAWMKVQQ